MCNIEGLPAHYQEGHSNAPQGCNGRKAASYITDIYCSVHICSPRAFLQQNRGTFTQDLHHKKGELLPQEALRLVGNEGPNGLLAKLFSTASLRLFEGKSYGCLAVPQQEEDMDKLRISDDTLAGNK
ncbi:hypothetical protein DPX16_19368 [Anabarilius grahami]|uniref:Uncharacterized protein n=1 Tax=Anabarilius grahami TaxID=495550 RepID=A0A3N0YZX5_ANAGA|nr:hypothetical protein DPX16_19368 [Anabarilius grahami]